MLKFFALAAALLVVGEARADLLYSKTSCGGLESSPCTVTQAYQPAANAAPLTEQAFAAWFSASIGPTPAGFSWYEAASNRDYSVGHVDGSNLIHTAYINGPDGLICCTADDPLYLAGINASNMLIGGDAMPFVTPVDDLNFLAMPRVVNGSIGWIDRMEAIDDDGNILGCCDEHGGFYELRPVKAPEPGALGALFAGLLAVAIMGRRKTCRG